MREKGESGDEYYHFSSPSSHPSSSSLFLHVESLHPHRDSLVTLTDPIVLPPDDDDDHDDDPENENSSSSSCSSSSSNNNSGIISINKNNNHNEDNNAQDVEIHKPFFADRRHRIAPIALALYAFGNYLNTHTHNPAIDSSTNTAFPPSSNNGGMLLFGLPIGGTSIDVDPMMLGGALIAIGLLTVTWTMDEIVHVVRQFMNDNTGKDNK